MLLSTATCCCKYLKNKPKSFNVGTNHVLNRLSKELTKKFQTYDTCVNTINNHMSKTIDQAIFKDGADYWQVAENIRDIYLSEGSLLTLLDFERVLDELDLYAFKNWQIGELVAGPNIGKYRVTCIFMWPERLMPDPRGGRRLLPFDCDVKYKKTMMQVPIKITDPSDYRPGTQKARLTEKPVWLVQISMPKSLMSDIRTGSVELEDQDIDLADLDDAYEQGLDQDSYQNDQQAQDAQQTLQQPTI
jgi:hypothetical protein